MTYKTVDDWLGELEGFSVRAERVPEGSLEWIRIAWAFGEKAALTAQQDGAREALAAAWLYGHCFARGFPFDEVDIPGCKGSKLWHFALEAADSMHAARLEQ